MKIKSGFLHRSIAGCDVVVPIGKRTADFNGMVNLNESGSFLWTLLEQGTTEDAMTAAVLDRYTDVDEKTARESIRDFVKILSDAGLLED